MTEIAIVGVGGQGRECLDVVEAMAANGSGLSVVGFFDDWPSAEHVDRLASRGQEVLGSLPTLLSRATPCVWGSATEKCGSGWMPKSSQWR